MEPKKNSNVDLRKRSVFFLQTGLILVLLIAYLGIEWKSYEKQEPRRDLLTMEEPDDEPIPITVLQQTPPPVIPPAPDIILVKEDEEPVIEDPIESTESGQEDIIDIKDIVEAPDDGPVEPVPFTLIEDVPIFPGCEGLSSNQERKDCMSEKITRFVNKNFNRDLGPQLNLKGLNRVNVIFQIDAKGNIINVQSRAPHPKLEEEAERVINSLPDMEPGKQRGKPVPVSYALPIIFQVQD